MARFMVVLQPRDPVDPQDLISALDPLVARLMAEVEHRTSAHLSAMLRDASDNLRLQLFADVQAQSLGPMLELVLMSREPMGRGAPLTRERFTQLLELVIETMPSLQIVFRSDQDGPLPGAR
jgi:hypothetical protein